MPGASCKVFAAAGLRESAVREERLRVAAGIDALVWALAFRFDALRDAAFFRELSLTTVPAVTLRLLAAVVRGRLETRLVGVAPDFADSDRVLTKRTGFFAREPVEVEDVRLFENAMVSQGGVRLVRCHSVFEPHANARYGFEGLPRPLPHWPRWASGSDLPTG